ncbi:NAD(P)H-dependent FMN reductase [Stackebrandtia albiflava]|uniref:NAD(P)H-dependent FMN reductase n=1 Tax=Stackebrandtia albiflava TaxID=406432 RepID=A0A562UYW0_9ACTN|nr:NADPH-dependent FMN reductase [Stackebrandtia albiflava]TWJ10748.1 NAD(P)H-dependent FMN reductase [Stackebrandtia albiflava]
MTIVPRVLLLPGSLRDGSVHRAVLRTAKAAVGMARGVLFDGTADLPHFDPDDDVDPLPPPVAALRSAVEWADALLICTPEYAGGLPGSFKNLLDWTVGGAEIDDKPVGWITAAPPGRGGGAEAALRVALEYTGARIVEDACRRIPVDRSTLGESGIFTDPETRMRITGTLMALRMHSTATPLRCRGVR